MSEASTKQPDESQTAGLIDEIIRMSDFTFDRLPMLDIIGDRFVENLLVALPELMRSPCEATLTSLDYVPLGKVIEDLPEPIFLAIAAGRPFVGEILLVVDQTILMTSVELMLGGSGKNVDTENTDDFTAIELGFGERVAAAIFAELEKSLGVVGAANLELSRIDTEAEGAAISKTTSLCARLRLTLTLAGNVGNLDLVIPYSALEQILPDLGKVYFGDRSTSQASWQESITAQIERAQMDLEVVLAHDTIPIQKIMSWRPGDTIEFGIEEGQDATITCADKPMFKASLGKRNNGYVAVQITEKLEIQEDHEDDRNDNR